LTENIIKQFPSNNKFGGIGKRIEEAVENQLIKFLNTKSIGIN